jgi:hypothetical protein
MCQLYAGIIKSSIVHRRQSTADLIELQALFYLVGGKKAYNHKRKIQLDPVFVDGKDKRG